MSRSLLDKLHAAWNQLPDSAKAEVLGEALAAGARLLSSALGTTTRARPTYRDTPDERAMDAAILGVPLTATAEQVKRAYKRRSHELHPDKGGDPELFRRLADAYQRALLWARPDKENT